MSDPEAQYPRPIRPVVGWISPNVAGLIRRQLDAVFKLRDPDLLAIRCMALCTEDLITLAGSPTYLIRKDGRRVEKDFGDLNLEYNDHVMTALSAAGMSLLGDAGLSHQLEMLGTTAPFVIGTHWVRVYAMPSSLILMHDDPIGYCHHHEYELEEELDAPETRAPLCTVIPLIHPVSNHQRLQLSNQVARDCNVFRDFHPHMHESLRRGHGIVLEDPTCSDLEEIVD